MFFLTEVDPRAAIKGSRDALGFTPVWARFGREVVGNLTTVTSSLRGFTTLLLGLYFVERVVSSGKASEEERSNLFLKFEQLAAYARLSYGKGNGEATGLLGLVRATRRLRDGQGSAPISAGVDGQILSNQKTNGLWGLYTVAARESGMVERDGHALTPWAQEFIESEYLPRRRRRSSRRGPIESWEKPLAVSWAQNWGEKKLVSTKRVSYAGGPQASMVLTADRRSFGSF